MSFYDRGTSWFLAQLKPNSVKIADRNLKRQGFRTFLPMEETTKRSRSKFVTTEQPMFPGYIFVAFDVRKGGWRAINSTNGVTRLVSFGNDPAAVPREIVAQLMMRCDIHGKLLPPDTFSPGEEVVFTQGPFANLVAEIEGAAPERRVWVLMDIMGNQTRVAVEPNQLRPA